MEEYVVYLLLSEADKLKFAVAIISTARRLGHMKRYLLPLGMWLLFEIRAVTLWLRLQRIMQNTKLPMLYLYGNSKGEYEERSL